MLFVQKIYNKKMLLMLKKKGLGQAILSFYSNKKTLRFCFEHTINSVNKCLSNKLDVTKYFTNKISIEKYIYTLISEDEGETGNLNKLIEYLCYNGYVIDMRCVSDLIIDDQYKVLTFLNFKLTHRHLDYAYENYALCSYYYIKSMLSA